MTVDFMGQIKMITYLNWKNTCLEYWTWFSSSLFWQLKFGNCNIFVVNNGLSSDKIHHGFHTIKFGLIEQLLNSKKQWYFLPIEGWNFDSLHILILNLFVFFWTQINILVLLVKKNEFEIRLELASQSMYSIYGYV